MNDIKKLKKLKFIVFDLDGTLLNYNNDDDGVAEFLEMVLKAKRG